MGLPAVEIKTLNKELSVCGQLHSDDIAAVKDRGFRTVMCLRPDGEGEDQPSFEAIAAAASDAGLEVVYIPVIPGQMGPEHIAAYNKAMAELPKPVLAYCRSGARAQTLAEASAAARS